MKVLLVTSRNIYGTSGELRLIKNRTETLSHIYGVGTDVLLYKKDHVLKNKQEVFDYTSFEGVYYNLRNHVSKFFEFKSIIKRRLKEVNYDAVIISGVFLFFNMSKYIRRVAPNTKIITDIHGTIEELKEFPGKNLFQKIIRRILYCEFNRGQNVSFKYSDGFFVVSNALKESVKKSLKRGCEKAFFIVPCGIKETEINDKESKKNRILYRSKYGVSDDEKLFIYSGGVSPWQCIEESVALFEGYCKETTRKCKMLILSGNLDYIKKFKSDNIITDSYSGDEVRKVLCAGDYAFLLRGNYMTNHVAYPNKFLEYVSSGMRIIATENVDDVAMQIRKYSVGTILDFGDSLYSKIGEEQFDYLSDIKERNSLLLATSFKTTLKPFVDYLKA